MVTPPVAVIHLVWLPFGIDLFKDFIRSYKNYDAGHAHDLVILFNGVKDSADTEPYHDYLKQHDIRYSDFYLAGDIDIVAYHKVARSLHHQHLLFLNSYAVLLAAGWLHIFVEAMKQENVGIVGATGSWQSYYTTVFQVNRYGWEHTKSGYENIRKYKLLLKAFFYWRFLFKAFPNPHIRTNSFLINRQLFLDCDTSFIKNKFGAYLFESGRRGLSASLIKKGLKLVVIDRSGRSYESARWPESATFHMREQEGLLVSDNRTREYAESSTEKKKLFTYLAWGQKNEV